MNYRAALFLAGVLLLTAVTARAVIVFGSAARSTSPPPNGAPWEYVARFPARVGQMATGVYLGNNFVLTVAHVATPDTTLIDGGVYARDESFLPRQIGRSDLKVFKILRHPGRGSPQLPPLPLTGPADDDLNRSCVVIGWGAGKGWEIRDQGWQWGDPPSREQRWGTNHTLPEPIQMGASVMLVTEFNMPEGDRAARRRSTEAAMAAGDSGGGLFQQFNGAWKLSGIAATVQYPDHSTYLPPTKNFFVRIREYRAEILRITEQE